MSRASRHAEDRGYEGDDEYAGPAPGKATLTQRIQRRAHGSAPPASATPASIGERAADGVAGGGGPVPFLADMEGSFGTSFRHVSAHTDAGAQAACNDLGADAYASGSQIAFASASPSRELVAHELAHVVQQGGGRGAVQAHGVQLDGDPAAEAEADRVAAEVSAGRSVGAWLDAMHGVPAAAPSIQRKAAAEDTLPLTERVGHGDLSPRSTHAWSFACFFFKPGDAYGQAARAYISEYFPDHHRIEARSFEDMFGKVGAKLGELDEANGEARGYIDELVIVAHANKAGGMKIPLTKDGSAGTFTPWNVAELQRRVQEGKHQKLMGKRGQVLPMITEDTRIVVRGCELGKSDDALDALRVLFGGQPTVVAPTEFQGFSTEFAGAGRRWSTPEEAFDWLAANGYIHTSDEELTPQDKREYIASQFPGGIPTDFFVVGEDAYREFKALDKKQKLGAEGEKHKTRTEDPFAFTGNSEHWNGRIGEEQAEDLEYDGMDEAALVAEAERLSEPYRPEHGGRIVRIHKAWQRRRSLPNSFDQIELRDPRQPIDPLPAVFESANLTRAEQDSWTHPDTSSNPYDAFTDDERMLEYTKPADTAAAEDFSASMGMGVNADGSHDASVPNDSVNIADGDHGITRVGDDGLRLWGFGSGASGMNADFEAALYTFAATTGTDARLVVSGHTDGVGSRSRNKTISRDRAAAVVAVLVEAGIPRDAIEIQALGESLPLEKEAKGAAGAAARTHNRRVEVSRGGSVAATADDDREPAAATSRRKPRRKGPRGWSRKGKGLGELIGSQDHPDGIRVYNFAPGTATLDDNQEAAILAVQDEIERSERWIRVTGHTSADEDPDVSDARAAAVTAFLKRSKYPMDRVVQTVGLGNTQPLGDDETRAGQARNRRAEVLLVDGMELLAEPETPGKVDTDFTARDAPAKGKDTDFFQYFDVGSAILTTFFEGLLPFVVELVGPIVGMVDFAMTQEAAARNIERAGFFDGLSACASSAATDIRVGAARVDGAAIYARYYDSTDWARRYTAFVLEGMSGFKSGCLAMAGEVFNPAMAKLEEDVRARLELKHKTDAAGIYEKIIGEIRGEIAVRLRDYVVERVAQERKGS